MTAELNQPDKNSKSSPLPSRPIDLQRAIPTSDIHPAQEENRRLLGDRLHAARLAVGMSEEAMAQTTRIAQPFIVALEKGQVDQLPSPVYGRGFVQSICRTSGIDAEELTKLYHSCWEQPLGVGAELKLKTLRGRVTTRVTNRSNATQSHELPPSRSNGEMPDQKTSMTLPVKPSKMKSISTRVVSLSLVGAIALGAFVYFAIGHDNFFREGSSNSSKAVNPAKNDVEVANVEQPTTPEIPQDVAAKTEAENKPAAPVAAPIENAAKSGVSTPALPSLPAANPVATHNEPEKTAAANPAALPIPEQILEINVKTPVRMKISMDRGTQEVKELKPDSYQFKFKQTADIMIYNAAAVDVRFNGRSLGSLGTAGRIRRLSFSAPMENAELANPFGVDRKL